MEHLVVRFQGRLPYRLERLNDRSLSFQIPKTKRLKTLQFMKKHPQHIVKKGKSSWEVIGIPPQLKQRGGQNTYRTFLSGLKKVLAQVPDHELSRLPLVELQKVPRIKTLYERYFKNHPELINPASLVNLVSSSVLGYDNDTGAVRDSIADVRKKKAAPKSIIPSLQLTKENEFDRILLLVLNRFLTDKGIPEEFLKSTYFTLRPQLLQLYQEDPAFRARLEDVVDRVEQEIARDYKMLVNETNRTYLSRYPFEDVAQALGIHPSVRGFTASKNKLDTIKQHSLTIPGSTQKFTGLQQLSETYTRTPESKFINVQHFMRGLQDKMTNDHDFVQSVLRNGSRSYQKVSLILEGKSIP